MASSSPPPRHAWQRFHPLPSWRDPILERIDQALERPAMRVELRRLEEAEEYPHGVLERLYTLGLGAILVEADDDAPEQSTTTPYHLYALNAIIGRLSGSLAITVGVNFLALLPVWIGGTTTQLRRVARRIAQGAFVSMAITEMDRGSDILRNRTRAEPGTLDEKGAFVPARSPSDPATHYRVRGEKQLINGASFHDLFITFTRTREGNGGRLGALRNFSFLIIGADTTITRPYRWRTLPARSADIASVRFNDTIVSKENLLGAEGSGFELLQRTLAMSRGGVGAIAAGTTARARELALAYAQERRLNGVPIVAFGAVVDHLLKLEALDLLVAATANKAAAMVNASGHHAAHYTAVAKFLCCVAAEEAVHHGYRVLSARSLLRDDPYERLLRDCLLYGVFEGTTHVMLDRLQSRLARVASTVSVSSPLDELRRIYATPPRRVLDVCREGGAAYAVSPDVHARALAAMPGVPLAPLVKLCESLLEVVRGAREGHWRETQSIRTELAEVYANIEGLFALVELIDPDRRAALGIPPAHVGSYPQRDAFRYALGELGGRACRTLRAIAVRVGATTTTPLSVVEDELLADLEDARGRLHDHLVSKAGAVTDPYATPAANVRTGILPW